MTLHIVQSSPFSGTEFKQCIANAAEQDCIVLICDAVYAIQATELQTLKPTIYILREDAIMRGINTDDSAQWISYAQMVELTALHSPILNWG